MVALVTGANQGIGRGVAIELAKAGADVAVNDHEHSVDTDEVVAEIEKHGRRAIVVAGDVSDWDTIDAMVSNTVKQLGRLDIAVANAAFSERDLFTEADLPGFHRTFDVTFWGAFNLLRAASLHMIEAGNGGSIVCIGSPHAYLAIPRSMAYNSAKAAVEQMARTAAIELVDHRIRVNIVCPGWIDTPGERRFATEEQIAAAAEKLPWKRLGQPEEIGRGVAFLCDPQSDYVTGSTLKIDGGITLPWWAARGSGVPE